MGALSLDANISVKNIFNNRYELVGGYPMPSRSLIGGIDLRF